MIDTASHLGSGTVCPSDPPDAGDPGRREADRVRLRAPPERMLEWPLNTHDKTPRFSIPSILFFLNQQYRVLPTGGGRKLLCPGGGENANRRSRAGQRIYPPSRC